MDGNECKGTSGTWKARFKAVNSNSTAEVWTRCSMPDIHRTKAADVLIKYNTILALMKLVCQHSLLLCISYPAHYPEMDTAYVDYLIDLNIWINPLQQELSISTPASSRGGIPPNASTRGLPPLLIGGDGGGAALDVLDVAGVAEKVAVQRIAAVTLLVVQLYLAFLSTRHKR